MKVIKLITYKQICCTCLSRNRKNYKLIQINDGVNVLYNLLFHDREYNQDGFTKDIAKLYVCWECREIIRKIMKFKSQVCKAQKRLASQSSDCIAVESLGNSLSRLSTFTENTIDIVNLDEDAQYLPEVLKTEELLSSYDCKPAIENKQSSKMVTRPIDNNETDNIKIKLNSSTYENKEFYTVIKASEMEIQMEKNEKKLHINSVRIKCDICIQKFKDNKSLKRHILNTHTQRKNYVHCDECNNYIKKSLLNEHCEDHKQYYRCQLCNEIIFLKKLMKHHLQVNHKKRPAEFYVRKTPFVKNPGSKPRLYPAMKDKETRHGYACPDCNNHFLTKRLRYNHIQKQHREGFKCEVCFKVFSFRAHLKKHQFLHTRLDLDRVPCLKCGMSIRMEMMDAHIQRHAQRSYKFECTPCRKRFKSNATYDQHMRYTKAHATRDLRKYKCDHCGKGYRSKVEVRDHIHYTHMGKTQHACPICKKPVPTKKSIAYHIKTWHNSKKTDHVKRAMCQICGQLFGCTKILREHMLRHTGERPLSCEICGNTFRQKACLYTHKRLVHKILYPKKKQITLIR